MGAVALRRLGRIYPYLPSGVYERIVARFSPTGCAPLVLLCWLASSQLLSSKHSTTTIRAEPCTSTPARSKPEVFDRVGGQTASHHGAGASRCSHELLPVISQKLLRAELSSRLMAEPSSMPTLAKIVPSRSLLPQHCTSTNQISSWPTCRF